MKGLTQIEVADRLRRSTTWIRNLSKRGVLTRNDDGSYPWPQVAEEYEAFLAEGEDDDRPNSQAPDYDAARTRKALVEALLREDELAVKRGDLIPAGEVMERVRRPLEAVDAQLRTAVRRHSKAWATKLGVSQAEAMALMHDIIEDVRADLRAAIEGDDGNADAAA